jgi:hypothetical protein
MPAAPLAFPSADGPWPSRQAPGPADPGPVRPAPHAWPLTPTLIGAFCAVAAFSMLLQSGLARAAGARLAPAAWSVATALAAAALAGWLLGRRLNRPIRALSAHAEALALRYAGQVPVRGRNPMRDLQASFEAMSGALLAQFERLGRLHLDELQNSMELQRRYALMRVLRNVSTAALECEHLEQVLEHAVEEVGGYLDWPVGRVLIVGEAGQRDGAKPRSVWFVAEAERFAPFIAASEAEGAEYSAHGLIGLAGTTGMPHWVTDLDRLGQWERRGAAVESGLKSGFVIPIAGDGSTHAFLEFFSDHRVEASPEMIELIEAIHIELWQAGQWRRERLRRAQLTARSSPGCASRRESVPFEAGVDE